MNDNIKFGIKIKFEGNPEEVSNVTAFLEKIPKVS